MQRTTYPFNGRRLYRALSRAHPQGPIFVALVAEDGPPEWYQNGNWRSIRSECTYPELWPADRLISFVDKINARDDPRLTAKTIHPGCELSELEQRMRGLADDVRGRLDW